MAQETILQHWIFTKFAFPFLLIFAIVFALLEKTKILGEDKHQINAIVAFVIGMVFVGAAYPKDVVSNLILFLTVALIVVFVTLLLWGFVSGGEAKLEGNVKNVALGVMVIAVIIAVLWAAGVEGGVYDWLFKQSWSGDLWTNVLFVVVIAGALAWMIKGAGSGS